jgi:hypothetical protein
MTPTTPEFTEPSGPPPAALSDAVIEVEDFQDDAVEIKAETPTTPLMLPLNTVKDIQGNDIVIDREGYKVENGHYVYKFSNSFVNTHRLGDDLLYQRAVTAIRRAFGVDEPNVELKPLGRDCERLGPFNPKGCIVVTVEVINNDGQFKE